MLTDFLNWEYGKHNQVRYVQNKPGHIRQWHPRMPV